MDTLYSQAWLDIGAEPMVYVLPETDRFCNVQLLDAWTNTAAVLDKAGAYGIQGSFAAHIRGIDGSYTNVMGLPVGRLYQELKRICPEKIEELLKHTV